MTNQVAFPTSVRFDKLCQFSKEVELLPKASEIVFLTDEVKRFTPTSMMMLAKTCRKRARKYPTENIKYRGLRKHEYANNLGFSDALNLKGRPYPQGAFGGKTYFPFSSLRRAELESAAAEAGIEIGDAIQNRANGIAEVVSQLRDDELQEVLANSFREIFRNTFEHANVSGAMFCAQYWPTREEVEICISDRGIGIKQSLAENPNLNPSSDAEAIKSSLMPGISSKAWRYKKRKASQNTDWYNSGYGLFFAHRLFGQLGSFGLASGNSAIWIEKGKPAQQLVCSVAGTVASMRLDLSDTAKISECIAQIRKDAHSIKQRLGTKSINIASVDAYLTGGEI